MIVRICVVPLIVAGLAIADRPAAAEEGDALGAMIEQTIRAEGPFFTPDEQAVINRACGYAPGEWDGYDINMTDDVLHCSNGRTVDSPEVRRVMAVATPRITRRVEAVMARPEITAAIARVAEKATAEALRNLDFDGTD